MVGLRSAALLVGAVAALFAIGCGNQPARVLVPHDAGERSSSTLAGIDGPRLCLFNEFFIYCYPGPGYCPCPSAEIPFQVRASQAVAIHWVGRPSPGSTIRWYRWALDIEDVADETPRVDENTDLSHWSQRSADGTSAQVGPFGNGEIHRLYVEVQDDQGLRSLGIARLEVGESRPPDNCASVTVNPAEIWPPNHRFVPVRIAGVVDPGGEPASVRVQKVTQDEPVRFCPDAVIRPDGTVELRAERSGRGNGRVYTIHFTATDPSGASCNGSVQVCVPHDRNRACVDDGQSFSSTGPCPRRGREPRKTSPIESRADRLKE
jgi:hypothetical protein